MRMAWDIRGDFRAEMRQVVEDGKAAVHAAVGASGALVQRGLRAMVQSGLQGNSRGVANAWRLRLFPGRPSLGAAALVWTKAPTIIDAFNRGVVIRGKDGGWLAIPTDDVKARMGRRRRITPREFAARTGVRLDMVYTGKQFALLVARGVAGRNGRGFKPATKGRLRRGAKVEQLVAFVLVRMVRLRKRWDMDAAVNDALRGVTLDIVSRWRDTPTGATTR